MLYEIDIEEGTARFAELIATIDAGFGVLVRRDGQVIARLVPEAAFAAMTAGAEADDGLTDEEREAREMMAMFDDDMQGRF
jgi:antitoxin (DNA-binding transcriptional repressor) of toxin-antitoxin stability system